MQKDMDWFSITPARGFESSEKREIMIEDRGITLARGFESSWRRLSPLGDQRITPARGFESLSFIMVTNPASSITPLTGV